MRNAAWEQIENLMDQNNSLNALSSANSNRVSGESCIIVLYNKKKDFILPLLFSFHRRTATELRIYKNCSILSDCSSLQIFNRWWLKLLRLFFYSFSKDFIRIEKAASIESGWIMGKCRMLRKLANNRWGFKQVEKSLIGQGWKIKNYLID